MCRFTKPEWLRLGKTPGAHAAQTPCPREQRAARDTRAGAGDGGSAPALGSLCHPESKNRLFLPLSAAAPHTTPTGTWPPLAPRGPHRPPPPPFEFRRAPPSRRRPPQPLPSPAAPQAPLPRGAALLPPEPPQSHLRAPSGGARRGERPPRRRCGGRERYPHGLAGTHRLPSSRHVPGERAERTGRRAQTGTD